MLWNERHGPHRECLAPLLPFTSATPEPDFSRAKFLNMVSDPHIDPLSMHVYNTELTTAGELLQVVCNCVYW